MFHFIENLRFRNETLFYFGLICLVLAGLFLLLTKFTSTQIYGVNAWHKPFKFALSTTLYAWAMLWFCYELPSFNVRVFNWAIILLLGFEIVYIAIQAGRGQLSHYNLSSPMYSALYSAMAIAAALVSVYTAYIAVLFFQAELPQLPAYYVWGIRAGLVLFVIFSLQGFAMGSRLTHTIGGPDGSAGLPVLHWSKTHGDLRIAHFLGMHALQIIPILSYYVLKNTKAVALVAVAYALVTLGVFVQALQGKPLFK
jgi:hypothetical protein